MKWKKVSEYPLPIGNGKQWYVLKLILSDIEIVYRATSCPQDYNFSTAAFTITEWCEFNPDEIESCEPRSPKMENAMASDPDYCPDINKAVPKFHESSAVAKMFQETLRSIHVNQSDLPKSATEVAGEFKAKQEVVINKAMVAKSLIEKPSWEEKFRWETARMLFKEAIRRIKILRDIDFTMVVKDTDQFIEELKRGRE